MRCKRRLVGLKWLWVFGLVGGLDYSGSVLFAQGEPFVMGARAWGLGNATVTLSDPYAIGSNVAGIATITDPLIFSSVDTYYSIPGIHTLTFGGVLPIGTDRAGGFTICRFGDQLYNEVHLGIGVGHKLDWASLGVKVNYLQVAYNLPSWVSSQQAVSVELGGIIELSNQLCLGAHIYNLLQGSFSGAVGSRLPTVLKLGGRYRPIEELSLVSEINKNSTHPLVFKVGLDYRVFKVLSLRTGLSSGPMTQHFGAGFRLEAFRFDYAVHSHPHLGWSQHLSLGYLFIRPTPEDGTQ
ncbi:hypothetical protein CLV98_101436 [Dyadobacter jejuensis]|uniref:PorV/PorQ family protein n=1 Tax=Dyadobacter jejuensis TaxID=1082580 RepID=A0A316ARA3_9BACT|nr:hypothetical protein [Dyadobacter jejuensis]PWJ60255.1 hypothetical protein CLV98_101436 [Dyadobacter jejuensis]